MQAFNGAHVFDFINLLTAIYKGSLLLTTSAVHRDQYLDLLPTRVLLLDTPEAYLVFACYTQKCKGRQTNRLVTSEGEPATVRDEEQCMYV